jgi:hypothetical protein
MNVIVSERKNSQNCIQAYDGVTVVVDIAFKHPEPIVHLVVVIIKVRGVVLDAEKHFEKVNGFVPQSVIHYFTIIKILENIRGSPVSVIVGVQKIHAHTGCQLD